MSTKEIGKLLKLSTFEWSISSIPTWLSLANDYVTSPIFHLETSHWYLTLSLNSGEWIGVFLRRHSADPQTVTYTIRLQSRYGTVEITETASFSMTCVASGTKRFLKTEEAWNRIFLHPFTVTCHIECNTSNPVQAGNVMVHYFGKKEAPDSVSCAVQTEDTSSMNEKENHKDQDWSSLDTKDDALLRMRMKELLNKGTDHDVTIFVQNKEFRAHRSILSTRSPVFAMMLSHDTKENNTGTINIEDCDPESFDEFLMYVYSGRTENLSPSNALKLYYTADKYDFPVLKERCVSLLKASLSVSSICDVVLLAAKHQEKEILEVATEFFARNIKKIIITVGWQKFMSQNPVEANELYIKSMEILLPEN